jgi:hypothetical protein
MREWNGLTNSLGKKNIMPAEATMRRIIGFLNISNAWKLPGEV